MFLGFNTAVRGLLASQRALYTVGHNIDNSSRLGYSRQEVVQRATDPRLLPSIGYQGTGTEISSIIRLRDSFVDYKYWNEKPVYGEWASKNFALAEVEKIMGEPSESSFRQYLDDFYASLDYLSQNPEDLAFREPVIENGNALAKHINESIKRFEKMEDDLVDNLKNQVDKINQIGKQIGILNRQIYMQEIDGLNANDLRDERELLVDEISQLVDIRVSESPEGHFDLSIGGNSLVNHFHSKEIRLNLKEDIDEENKEDYLREILQWSTGGRVDFKSGEVRGSIDLLYGDGKNNHYRGIPFYKDQIDHFASKFAEKFNQQHRQGYDLYGEEGLDFFTFSPGAGPGLGIRVNEAILKDVRKFAGSSVKESVGNNDNILRLIEERESRDFFDDENYPQGTPDDFIRSIMSSMAVDSMHTDRFLETQKLLEKNLENKRQSISGVNLNDEMTNMVKYQQVYAASARMITTLDSILDVTINRLGLVGR